MGPGMRPRQANIFVPGQMSRRKYSRRSEWLLHREIGILFHVGFGPEQDGLRQSHVKNARSREHYGGKVSRREMEDL
jgi:hypothetical protein